jgi:hypothetical protein
MEALHELCAAHARCLTWWKNKDSSKHENKRDEMGRFALVSASMTSKSKELLKRGETLAQEMTALTLEKNDLDKRLQAKMKTNNEKLTVSDCLDAFQVRYTVFRPQSPPRYTSFRPQTHLLTLALDNRKWTRRWLRGWPHARLWMRRRRGTRTRLSRTNSRRIILDRSTCCLAR